MLTPNGSCLPIAPSDDLAAALAGDRLALARLWSASRQYLLLIANRELSDSLSAKVAASDVVQETLASAQAKLPEFRGRTEPELFTWLRSILHNELADTYRRYVQSEKRTITRERSLDQCWDEGSNNRRLVDLRTPGQDLVAGEDGARLWDCLALLSPDHRRVIELRNWERRSFPEIGRELGRSAEAARKLWFRALTELARHWEAPLGNRSE